MWREQKLWISTPDCATITFRINLKGKPIGFDGVNMRGLSTQFMEDLAKGKLMPYLELVKTDGTLNLEIFNDYVTIFYRGQRLYAIKTADCGYVFEHTKPIIGHWAEEAERLIEQERYFDAIPYLKSSWDARSKKDLDEKETQQIIVRENNVSSVAKKNTDYFLVAFEYEFFPGDRTRGIPDLVAVRFDSDSNIRKKGKGQLAIIELKYGDNAIGGESGLNKHIADAEVFFSDIERVDALKKEAELLFNQKYELGIIKSPKKIVIEDSKPEYIIALANHDPCNGTGNNDGESLYDMLKPYENKTFDSFDLKLAIASGVGYGLYSDCMLSVDEFLYECKRFVK